MIKKIRRIKDFGIFSDFSSNSEVKDFAKYNLIYGWNYSGKTTLSRIFRCFEQGCMPSGFTGASFEIIDTDETVISEQYLDISHTVRVFNSDFVEENLKWDVDLEPIFLIGHENIEKQEELDFEKDNQRNIRGSLLALKNTVDAIDKNTNESLTAKARDLKQTLSLPDYNKTKFQAKVLSIANTYEQHALNDVELGLALKEYFNSEKKDKLLDTKIIIFDTKKLEQKVSSLLETTVVSKAIDRIKENEDLQNWIKTGLSIHKEKTQCEFCGGVITSNLLEMLNEHFSDDFDLLMNDIDKIINALRNIDLKLDFPDTGNLYQELKHDYTENKIKLDKLIDDFKKQIEIVITVLTEKKGKAFTKIKFYELIDYTETINGVIKELDKIIKIHNVKTDNFNTVKDENREKIILHYCSEYISDNSYFQKIEHRNKNLLSQSSLEESSKLSSNRIEELESVLSESVKGADKINEYLESFFGKNDLKIIVNQNSKFQLFRKGLVAKNLSEGEKTAIAFAYFITKLEDKTTRITDTIVYLDDPISSLDSNHIFNIYAFIKMKLSSCKQLFISTHNSEFFNIIKDWYNENKNKKALYLVERSTNASIDESHLKNIPLLMDKYKSEYVYLFSVINDFKNGPSMDFQMLYNLPNIMRRFLESYVSFKIPKSAGLEKKLKILFDDPIKLERVNKFVQQNSHTSSISSGMQFPNLTEVAAVIDLIFDMIITKDSDHFAYLLEAANGNVEL